MAKILYGVCGEGLGHASRSRILINHLQKNHEIKIAAGGKAYTLLSKNFKDVQKIQSPHFMYKKGQVRLLYSILKILYQTMVATPKSLLMIRKTIKEFKPDVILTDADPITYNLALLKKLPRISIDNPQAIIYRKYKVKTSEFWPWFALVLACKIAAFNADKYVIYDFSEKRSTNKKVIFLKPLIQQGILHEKPKEKHHIFVYQTSQSTEFISEILKKIDEKFIIYGFAKNQKENNLIFKKFNENEFYQDIAHSKAVITNGGFTVLSEALYLKKPIFTIPIKRQFEQVLNGKFIENLGVGVSCSHVNEKNLTNFLRNLDTYKAKLKTYDPGNQNETLRIIEHEIQVAIKTRQ